MNIRRKKLVALQEKLKNPSVTTFKHYLFFAKFAHKPRPHDFSSMYNLEQANQWNDKAPKKYKKNWEHPTNYLQRKQFKNPRSPCHAKVEIFPTEPDILMIDECRTLWMNT